MEDEQNPPEMMQEVGTLDPSTIEALQEGETITLSLEEASQLLLDGAEFAPGTYQILTTPDIIQNGEVPFEIINGDQETLLSFLPQNATTDGVHHATTEDGRQMMIHIKTEDESMAEIQEPVEEGVDQQHTLPEEHSQESEENNTVHKGDNSVNETLPGETEEGTPSETVLNSVPITTDVNLGQAEGQASLQPKVVRTKIIEGGKTPQSKELKTVKTEPKPDLASPISVSDRTEVVINGKKCVLLVNPDTKEMCAYPILPPEGKKRRGRPKKAPKTPEELAEEEEERKKSRGSNPSQDVSLEGGADQATSAVEGLLELSNTGPDGVRRSNRPRKKTKTLEEYEALVLSGDEDDGGDAGAIDDDDDDDADIVLPGYKRRKLQDSNYQTSFATLGEKRPRGRPRRYPPPGQTTTTSSIPAVLIPSQNGQTLMMAPLQGVQNLHSLQQQVKSLPNLMPRVSNDPSLSVVSTQTIFTSTDSELQDATNNLQIDPNSVLENNNMLTSLDGENLNLNTETSNLDLPDEKPVDGDEKPTIIQIPENLLPMFMPKKDPVRIGLKASESELEKLKCPKCDFQAYYPQQFQEHIGTHTDAIHKCKCCNFNSFDRDELLTHFKESHPRCICNICEFMAEHAYVIKRHMVRHNNQGCSCNICGKVYKDQYILKMHVKMVHMPAEVLFECNICLKKFTRKAHLKRHLRIHDPEKPFKCPHCDYRGCERSDISKHLLIHEEPKHVCEVCNKAFRHIKNKELHVKRHNGQKDYKCGVCGFYGYTFTDIRKHIERKHGDMKSLVCDRCGMAFKTEMILREHQKTSCGGVIEQALAIATSDGGTSQAMIQIPSTLSVDGQHITIDGQEISVDGGGAVNITFEQVLAADDEGIQLMEQQMADEEDITVTDGQVVTVTDAVNTQAIISQDHEIIEDEQQELELDLDDQVHAEEVDLDDQVHAEQVEQMLADS